MYKAVWEGTYYSEIHPYNFLQYEYLIQQLEIMLFKM